jgi:hypothetical protein
MNKTPATSSQIFSKIKACELLWQATDMRRINILSK